jgi:hypothetical protein
MSRVNKVQGSARCEVCGNSRGQCFEVRLGGERHIFDSFEFAMDALTPRCAHCGCSFVGHGLQFENAIYCSYQCANDDGVREYEARIILREQANF